MIVLFWILIVVILSEVIYRDYSKYRERLRISEMELARHSATLAAERARRRQPVCQHAPEPVRLVVTGELVGHVCSKCLEEVPGANTFRPGGIVR